MMSRGMWLTCAGRSRTPEGTMARSSSITACPWPAPARELPAPEPVEEKGTPGGSGRPG